MKRILSMLLLLPFAINAQDEKGIKFEEGLNWPQVLAKAKAENKYIFVDCFATWCGPCKTMDENVYPNEKVGSYVNEKFISVKVQMDKTDADNENVKKWYDNATMMQFNYTVSAFPTFLFFSPDGKPIHKSVGGRNADGFIAVAKDALDPGKQYYQMLANFRPGAIDTSEMKGLALSINFSGNVVAEKIAADYLGRIPSKEIPSPENSSLLYGFRSSVSVQNIVGEYIKNLSKNEINNKDNQNLILLFRFLPNVQDAVYTYIKNLNKSELQANGALAFISAFNKYDKIKEFAANYIAGLSEKEIYTKENIGFLTYFTTSSQDRGFKVFYSNAEKINSVMGKPGYAKQVIDGIVLREEINPVVAATKEGSVPDWEAIKRQIESKYDTSYSESNILSAKVTFYDYMIKKYKIDNENYWHEYINAGIEQISKYGKNPAFAPKGPDEALNNFCWFAVFFHSNDPDQIKIAVGYMEGVVSRNEEEAGYKDTYANLLYKAGRKDEAIAMEEKATSLTPRFQKTLDKMKRGEPTWSVPTSDRKKQ